MKFVPAPRNLLLGQAGVYRVLSELALRGISSYLPVVDVGVDLITDSGLKVQVKAATLKTRPFKKKDGSQGTMGPAYFISLSWNQIGAGRKAQRRPRKYSEEVAFFVIWGIDEDRFFIVPAHVLDNKQGLMICKGQTKVINDHTAGKVFVDKVYASENCWHFLTREVPEQSETSSQSNVVIPFLREVSEK